MKLMNLRVRQKREISLPPRRLLLHTPDVLQGDSIHLTPIQPLDLSILPCLECKIKSVSGTELAPFL